MNTFVPPYIRSIGGHLGCVLTEFAFIRRDVKTRIRLQVVHLLVNMRLPPSVFILSASLIWHISLERAWGMVPSLIKSKLDPSEWLPLKLFSIVLKQN